MEQKISSLKTASRIISVLTKIGYTLMAVMTGICAAMLIFLAVTGGETSGFRVGETNIIVFDELASTPAQLMAMCLALLVMGGFLFVIFLLAHQMFNEISLTGKPFKAKYVKAVRAIGVFTAALPFAAGFVEFIVAFFTQTEMPEIASDVPGIVVGAIIFCLSYIIDYGCGLEGEPDGALEGETKRS